jgi:rhodanese-related sulfurtransferase
MGSPDKRGIKNALYEEFARIGKAVASPHRLEILDLLSQGEKSVEALAEDAALTFGNASAQLKVLREARLVESRRDGQRIYYRLAGTEVATFWLSLRDLAENRSAELRSLAEQFFSDPDGVAPVDRKSLLARARRGEVIVIDVRPADEFAAGHISGARSIPFNELKERLATLPKTKEIVAYCRGPYCVYAIDALTMLRKNGFRASRLEDSVHDWRNAGLPIDTGLPL